MGGLLGVANVSKNGLMQKNVYASRFRSKEVGVGKVVSFIVPRYTRGVLNVTAVSTQNTIFFTDSAFLVDMNSGKPYAYNIENYTVKYRMESQYTTIYMKFNSGSAVNIYLQHSDILPDQFIMDIEILDNFPSDVVSL